MITLEIECLIVALSILTYLTIRTNFILEHRYKDKYHYIFLMGFNIILLFSVIFFRDWFHDLHMITILVVYLIETLVLYKNNLSEKLFFIGFEYFMIFSINVLLVSVVITICSLNNPLCKFVFNYCRDIQVGGFFFIYFLVDINMFKFWKSGYLFEFVNNKKRKYIFNIALIFIIFVSSFGILSVKFYVLGGTIVAFTHIIIIFLIIFIILALLKLNIDSQEYYIFKNNKAMELKSVNKSLESMTKINEQKRILYHDIKHHLFAVKYFIDNEEIERAQRYIEDLGVKFKNIEEERISKNDLLNGIIIIKKDLCEKYNIKGSFNIKLGQDLFLGDYEVSALFSNLIDNAIEGNLRVKKVERRFLELESYVIEDALMIKLKNASDSKKKIDINKTRKTDKEIHGLGIKSIKDIVFKYGGEVLFENQNYIFETVVYIPIGSN